MKVILFKEEVEKIKKLIKGVPGEELPESPRKRKNLRRKMAFFEVLNNEILYNDSGILKKIIPEDDEHLQNALFKELHQDSHTGVKAMYQAFREKYIGCRRERINDYVKRCTKCTRYIPLKRSEPITPIVSPAPWALVQMDCIDLRKHSDDNDGYG